MADCYTLGIETSCDETSAAVVKNGRTVLSNVISSQTDIHERYGGVVPEIAARKHIETIAWIVDDALGSAGVALQDLDLIAVTYGPGLVGALLTGLSYAKGLAFAADKPLVGVHHIEAHICANYILDEPHDEPFEPPFLCLVVSGGHTNIVHVSNYGEYSVLGRTRDDAAGEAFDKVGRALGLPYPGGPRIDGLAKTGDDRAFAFPRSFLEEGSLDFSFSGLKSAVINALHKAEGSGGSLNMADVAASFQLAIVDVLVAKTILACNRLGVRRLAMAGGVSSNSALRKALAEACDKNNLSLHVPKAVFCTDNAAMVAVCGHFRRRECGMDLNAVPNLELGKTM